MRRNLVVIAVEVGDPDLVDEIGLDLVFIIADGMRERKYARRRSFKSYIAVRLIEPEPAAPCAKPDSRSGNQRIGRLMDRIWKRISRGHPIGIDLSVGFCRDLIEVHAVELGHEVGVKQNLAEL